MSESDLRTAATNDFFIGWLPMPSAYRRFLTMASVLLTGFVAMAAAYVASMQSAPGHGSWEDDRVVTVHGILRRNPYATIQVADKTDSNVQRTFLVVDDGKYGATNRVAKFLEEGDLGVKAEVTGTILHRDDRWMISLNPGEASLRLLEDVEMQQPVSLSEESREREPKRLQGEVIDPKCYLGAMKPGGGKTHKACAMRCISGGIPPMLVVRQSGQPEEYFLLVSEAGGIANELVLPFVGDRVEIDGELVAKDGLRKLYVRPDRIRRVTR